MRHKPFPTYIHTLDNKRESNLRPNSTPCQHTRTDWRSTPGLYMGSLDDMNLEWAAPLHPQDSDDERRLKEGYPPG